MILPINSVQKDKLQHKVNFQDYRSILQKYELISEGQKKRASISICLPPSTV